MIKNDLMKVSVWDTYVPRKNGRSMHFDILVPSELQDPGTVFDYGREYLATKPFWTGTLTAKECRFCHMETAPPEVEASILEKGFHIIEMENCNSFD